MPNLIVTCTFNPPVVKLMGSTLREDTVHKLESRLPTVTSTAQSPAKEPPKFVFHKDPAHWAIELGQQYCDHLGRSMIYLTIIEALEAEDWKLRASNCMTHYDTGRDTSKFFFQRG
jgi:hypothetical protein